VSPQEVKGLEFDALVVVEPEQIVAGDERGHRLLYVALTRTTRYLDIVCVGEPVPLTAPPVAEPEPVPAGPEPFGARDVERLAVHLAAQLRSAAPATAWQDVLNQLARRLSEEYEEQVRSAPDAPAAPSAPG
jgi:UvrD-like helicase C-terminal domain